MVPNGRKGRYNPVGGFANNLQYRGLIAMRGRYFRARRQVPGNGKVKVHHTSVRAHENHVSGFLKPPHRQQTLQAALAAFETVCRPTGYVQHLFAKKLRRGVLQ